MTLARDCESTFNLALDVHRHSLSHPDRLALAASGEELTYGDLARLSQRVAATLQSCGVRPRDRVGVLASRSIEACAGAIGAAWAGATYVPISLKAPEERLLAILDLADVCALVVDTAGAALLSERVLSAGPRCILVRDTDTARRLSSQARSDVRAIDAHTDGSIGEPFATDADALAYIMFTSGTTGVPKGVMISAGSVRHFVRVMQDRYTLTPDDRVAEPMELSFDISVFNMFVTWHAGASLHPLPGEQVMSPAGFIRDNRISVWFSVPSVISFMKRTKALKPGSLPTLRRSIFCGEPLPVESALAWRAAAENSLVDNLYGPTEATVACLHQWAQAGAPVTEQRGIVAIGVPFSGMAARVVDRDLKPVPPEQPGELALSGPQLATGYLQSPELTSMRFPVIDGARWYLTGDLAYQDSAGTFHHLGRIDNQVKVRGYRVELEEVEAHLRAVSGVELVAALAWPVAHGSADAIVAFVAGRVDVAQTRRALRTRLPSYMVPADIRIVDALPLSDNGKVDRRALLAMLDRPDR